MTPVVLAILGYVLLQLLVAFVVSRRIRSEDDYLVAGRSLGWTLTIASVFATWFGAETCIGAAGTAYDGGLSDNTAEPFGYGLCLVLMGVFFAGRIWRLRLSTLGDLFRIRYGRRVERIAAVLLIPGSVLWAAAQIRAFGQVLAAASEWSVLATTTGAAAVVIAYTSFGGLRADAVTDVLQGAVLVLGLAFLAAVVLAGGPGLSEIPAERLRFFSEGAAPLDAVEAWAIPVCGSIWAAELVTRVSGARTATIARAGTLAASLIYVAVGCLAVTLGLIGSVRLPGLDSGEHVFVALAESHLAGPLYVLFAGAIVSAILSTVDSSLLVAGSLLAHNLAIPALRIESERARVAWNRGAVVAFGVLAYALALHADGVYALVEEASAFASAGVFWTVLVALLGHSGGVPRDGLAAGAALVTGAVVYIGGSWVTPVPHPYLTSLLAAAVAFAAGLLWDRRPRAGSQGPTPAPRSYEATGRSRPGSHDPKRVQS